MDWQEVRQKDWARSIDFLEADHEQVRHGLNAIGLEAPREIRIITGGGVLSGVFDHLDQAADAVCEQASYQNTVGCYITLNPTTLPVTNQLHTGPATADEHIPRRTRLVIDIDPVRAEAQTGPATHNEQQHAITKAHSMSRRLVQEGWPEPGTVITPNGAQLWYRIDLTTDDDGLIRSVLLQLQDDWGDEQAVIDTSMHNAARIARIPGTPGRKPDSTGERPWRVSGPWCGPTMAQANTLANSTLIRTAAAKRPPEQPGEADNGPGDTADSLAWLSRWLDQHHVPKIGRTVHKPNGDTYLELAACPWEPEHGQTYRPFVGVHRSGRLIAGCHGARCEHNGWRQFRALYDQTYRRLRDQERRRNARRATRPQTRNTDDISAA